MEEKTEELEYLERRLSAISQGKDPEVLSSEENTTTIESLRKSWEVLDITSDGVIVKTPAGKFRLQEAPDGRLRRLERIDLDPIR